MAPRYTGRGWSVEDSRSYLQAFTDEAQRQAAFLERERPYSSPPPARHPVWSDALRRESAALRDEGLLDTGDLHPWEADPHRWPSADAATQARLVAVAQERQVWTDIVAELGDETVEGSTPQLDLPWYPSVSGDAVQTAKDYILTDGYSGKAQETERAADWIMAQEQAERLGDPAWQAVNDQHAEQVQLWAGGHLPGERAARAAAGELRAFFATRGQAQEREGMTW